MFFKKTRCTVYKNIITFKESCSIPFVDRISDVNNPVDNYSCKTTFFFQLLTIL